MKSLIITTDGFEDSEFSYPYYRLQEEGYTVDVVTPEGKTVEGKHGYTFDADYSVDEFSATTWADKYDHLVIPGGNAPERLRTEEPKAADIVAAFDTADQPISAICHGAQLLISADILTGRDITGYWTLEVDIENAGATYHDEEVVVDDNLVTSRVPRDLPRFMKETFELIETHTKAIA
ncbi:MAG: type 1 glutamine amidotransferase domain-containing protein [Halobacteriaceae archaeon]